MSVLLKWEDGVTIVRSRNQCTYGENVIRLVFIVGGGIQERWALLSKRISPGAPRALHSKNECILVTHLESFLSSTANWLGCDGDCKHWFHVFCLKLSDSDFSEIYKRKHWYCHRSDCQWFFFNNFVFCFYECYFFCVQYSVITITFYVFKDLFKTGSHYINPVMILGIFVSYTDRLTYRKHINPMLVIHFAKFQSLISSRKDEC